MTTSLNAISDHALLRYMERVHGVDVEHYRKCALFEIEAALEAGVCQIQLGGFWFVIKDKVLVTVLPPGVRPNMLDR